MKPEKVLVVATRNPGKTGEIRSLLSGQDVIIKDLTDFGPIPEIAEDGLTFDENAYKKAGFAARVLGFPAMADDSGLVVKALDGAPGVFSARYAGEKATDEENYQKLLAEMAGQEDRRAAFECVISIAVPTGAALTYEGRCKGEITTEPVGSSGFGYDPVFYFPPLQKTFAQLDSQEKNRVSHRGKALQEVVDEFDKVLTWIRQNMPIVEKFACNDHED
ncbi:MAG: XTP/dITP diphosphatase [Desulfosudaceae bacterium]